MVPIPADYTALTALIVGVLGGLAALATALGLVYVQVVKARAEVEQGTLRVTALEASLADMRQLVGASRKREVASLDTIGVLHKQFADEVSERREDDRAKNAHRETQDQRIEEMAQEIAILKIALHDALVGVGGNGQGAAKVAAAIEAVEEAKP